ncbi:MAG: hypothetical protein HY370_09270 [Proteobacteria bacterium]|nr:hypothetical protein [Pseudomonadota bacterium]
MADVEAPKVEKTEVSQGLWEKVKGAASYIRHLERLTDKGLGNASAGLTSLIVGGVLDAADNSPRLLGKSSFSLHFTGKEWDPITSIRGWYAERQKDYETVHYGAPLKAEGFMENAALAGGEMLLPVGGTINKLQKGGLSLMDAWKASREAVILKGYSYQAARIKAATVLDTAGLYLKQYVPDFAGNAVEKMFRSAGMALKHPVIAGGAAAGALGIDNSLTGSTVTKEIVRNGVRLGGLGLNLGATVMRHTMPTAFHAAAEAVGPTIDVSQKSLKHIKDGVTSAGTAFSEETGIAPETTADGAKQIVKTMSKSPIVKGTITASGLFQNDGEGEDTPSTNGSETETAPPAASENLLAQVKGGAKSLTDKAQEKFQKIKPDGRLTTAGIVPSLDSETLHKGVDGARNFAHATAEKAGELKDKAQNAAHDIAENGFMNMLGLDKLDKSMLLPMGLVVLGGLMGGMSSDDGNKILGTVFGAIVTVMALAFLMPKGMFDEEKKGPVAAHANPVPALTPS